MPIHAGIVIVNIDFIHLYLTIYTILNSRKIRQVDGWKGIVHALRVYKHPHCCIYIYISKTRMFSYTIKLKYIM